AWVAAWTARVFSRFSTRLVTSSSVVVVPFSLIMVLIGYSLCLMGRRAGRVFPPASDGRGRLGAADADPKRDGVLAVVVVAVGPEGLAASGLGKAAADHVADGQDGDVEPCPRRVEGVTVVVGA